VTPSSTVWGLPAPITETKRSIACGWSPDGLNSEASVNNGWDNW
jgi:hypothetical protein